jgi:ArsR family transcriptional regulator, lead/cadmium/zinc/bismuth-responsive transcriptional repressor
MTAIADHEHPLDADAVRTARQRIVGADDAGRLSGLLGLLGDPVRLRLLYALDVVGELCVGDLALTLDVSEDAASYGLRMLRTAGFVHARKEGRVVFYRLAETFPEPLLEHCLWELLRLSEFAGSAAASSPKRRRTR